MKRKTVEDLLAVEKEAAEKWLEVFEVQPSKERKDAYLIGFAAGWLKLMALLQDEGVLE